MHLNKKMKKAYDFDTKKAAARTAASEIMFD